MKKICTNCHFLAKRVPWLDDDAGEVTWYAETWDIHDRKNKSAPPTEAGDAYSYCWKGNLGQGMDTPASQEGTGKDSR